MAHDMSTSSPPPPLLCVDDDRVVQDILSLHASKIRRSTFAKDRDTRCVFLLHMNDDRTVSLQANFVRLTPDECTTAMDVEQRSVQWLMRQLMTYDPRAEFLAGVRFPNGQVLAHVFPRVSSVKRVASRKSPP